MRSHHRSVFDRRAYGVVVGDRENLDDSVAFVDEVEKVPDRELLLRELEAHHLVARQEPIGSHQDRFVKLRDGGYGLSPSASGQGSVKPSLLQP